MRKRGWFGGIAILTLASALASGQSSGLVIDTLSLPSGIQNVPYSQSVSATSQYPTMYYPITWSIVAGQLPGGLTIASDPLSPSGAALISGTPNIGVAASFTVQASQTIPGDVGNLVVTATQDLTIAILGITTTSLPAGTVGLQYSATFQSIGVPSGDTQSWTVVNTVLPPGLALSLGGVLSGVPTVAGSYPFVIQLACQNVDGAVTTVTQPYTLVITVPPVVITTPGPVLTPGAVGVAYTQQLTATGGVPPYSWSVPSGALPGGIGLNATTGLLSGTPTGAGTFNFQVTASDQSGGSYTSTFSIFVIVPLSISTAPTLPAGESGVPYSTTLSATGGTAPYTWSISALAGSLPPGLALNPTTGSLTGTPTASGNYQFNAGVMDAAERTASKLFTINIAAALTITTTSPLTDGTVGSAYQAQIAATGGVQPYAWRVSSGALPGGISLNGATGVLSGTPTNAGTFNFQLSVSDQSGGSYTSSFTLLVLVPLSISTAPTLPAGESGVPYSTTLSATGGTAPYTWSVLPSAGPLPPGLVLNPSTGSLTGTPTASGSYQFFVGVMDTSQRKDSKLFTINIAAALSITTTSPLSTGTVGSVYQAQLAATGGVPPYAWSVSSGALPDGISLNASTGVLSGTPTSANTFSFQLSANDQAGGKASGGFSIVVVGALTVTTAPALPGGESGVAYSTTLAATGGTAPYTWSVLPSAGPLPPGLALNPSTGSLTGTPTASGSYQFLAAVTDPAGRTASKLFNLNIAAVLTITTTSPLTGGTVGSAYLMQLTATGGLPPYTWSIAAGALPAGIVLNPASGLLSGTPSAGGTFDMTVSVKDAVQSVSMAFRLIVGAPALPAVTITGLPPSPPPATQPTLGIGLAAPYALDITGHATLTFTPDSTADDPAVQFTTGGRSADFQIPAGSTQAVFGASTLGVQTGTVAGTITITLQTFAAGVDVTPTPAPTQVLRIAPSPPVIVSAKLVATTGGFNLVVIGYATTRELTGAAVHLTPAPGAKLATSDFTIPLTAVFAAWYQDPASVAYGSQFSMTIPFTVQKVANAVASLTLTLSNSQGASAVANATF